MIDQEKLDWKEPLWAKFRNYAIGFGAALLLVGGVLAVLYFTLKPDDVIEKPAIAAQEAPATPEKVAKPAIKKAATKASNASAMPTIKQSVTVEKPVKSVEPLTQFDRDLANFESKIP